MVASASTRALWRGAISFGLVHIPVALHAATTEQGLNFDWLDKRSMDPVGYKRINKRTGKEIDKEDIVKGIEYEDDHYVVLSQEEIASAYPKATQIMLFPPPLVCAIAHPGKYKPFPLRHSATPHSGLCSFERNCGSMDEMIGSG